MIISFANTTTSISILGHLKITTKETRTFAVITIFLLILLATSCSEQVPKARSDEEIKHVYPPPVTVLLDTMPPPKRIDLKSVPKPRFVHVPKTLGGYYTKESETGKEKIQLSPSVTTKAEILVPHLTNFNTDNGLAINTIYCSWLDQSGNLWFGTGGGGVSHFDGTRFTNYSVEQGLTHPSVRREEVFAAMMVSGLSLFQKIRDCLKILFYVHYRTEGKIYGLEQLQVESIAMMGPVLQSLIPVMDCHPII
jgi:hypothetical protein